jgi:hypothetical protein
MLDAGVCCHLRRNLEVLIGNVGYCDPAHLAKIAAGVDLISRGRAGIRHWRWLFP